MTEAALSDKKLEPSQFDLQEFVRRVLAEDMGSGGDVTSDATIDADARFSAEMNCREPITVAGLDIAVAFFRSLDREVRIKKEVIDGDTVPAGTVLMRLEGNARAMLSAERSALNTLQHLSGIATLTRRYVDAIESTGAILLDTRKTVPGLRALDKQAVVAGGGTNHRFGLDDGILIKDNHVAIAGGVAAAVASARLRAPFGLRIEVEVESEGQLREALESGADLLLLDNRTPAEASRLVALARALAPRVQIEASGNVSLANVRAYADAGVDFISIGALTHSVRASDVSLEFELG